MTRSTTEPGKGVSDRLVSHVVQLLAFLVAMAVFPASLFATIRFATSPFEILVGVLLGGILASTLVIIGMVAPSAVKNGRA